MVPVPHFINRKVQRTAPVIIVVSVLLACFYNLHTHRHVVVDINADGDTPLYPTVVDTYPDDAEPLYSELNTPYTPKHIETLESKWTRDGSLPLYAVNTDTCKMPFLDPYHREIRRFLGKAVTSNCAKYQPLLTNFEKNKLVINRSILRDYYKSGSVRCVYEVIHRINDTAVELDLPIYFGGEVDVLAEFLGVSCPVLPNNNAYVFFHTNVIRKDEVEERCTHLSPLGISPEPYNVIILGIDSMSRSNMVRQLPKTRGYLLKELKAYEMFGYNKIDDDPLPNLFAILTGHKLSDIFDLRVGRRHFFDKAPFIWKDFATSGYRTLFAEDDPQHGCFNRMQRGFNETPTDYYYRPFATALEKERSLWWTRDCVGPKTEASLVLDYVNKFANEFKKDKYFAFALLSRLTHDNRNRAPSIDDQLKVFLQNLKISDQMQNTVVIFLSDHGSKYGGLRDTDISNAEKRLPALYLSFPEKFLSDYPNYENNLRINQNRLTTPFDVYQTLKGILSLDDSAILTKQTTREKTEKPSFSLLNEVDENRDCAAADISKHWCMCREVEEIELDSAIIQNAVQHAILQINNLLLPYPETCEELHLSQVLKGHFLLPGFMRQHSNLKTYMVTFTTMPGPATYEVTMDYDTNSKSYDIVGMISRTDSYEVKPRCTSDKTLWLYCQCKV